MPRRLRCNSGGYVYHALNRSLGRATLFRKDGDYAAFEKTLRQAKNWQPLRVLGYCLMPNHWHLFERNALRAGLVRRAVDWRWSSL